MQRAYPNNNNNVGVSDVQIQQTENEVLKNRLDKINEISDNKCVIGTVGNYSVKYKSQETVIRALGKLKREGNNQIVLLNGEDVSKEIRTEKIDENVAKYAAIKIVRDKITPIQQKMGENANIIMEGRDIGTVVFPNADVKIFLDCSL